MSTLQMPLQLNRIWATQGNLATTRPIETAVNHIRKKLPQSLGSANGNLHQMPNLTPGPTPSLMQAAAAEPVEDTINTLAFYRKHTENMLRRYLYASMQVGRSPDLLGENVGRGWVSSRKVTTFEDALIFVLDIERCLNRLTKIDRQMISRALLQEYTHAETAAMLGVSVRFIYLRLPEAIDRLTESLVDADLLTLPNQCS